MVTFINDYRTALVRTKIQRKSHVKLQYRSTGKRVQEERRALGNFYQWERI